MPFTTFYGPGTEVAETGLWIIDGTRRICLTYRYTTDTGLLRYAACVFRCEVIPSESGMVDHIVEPTYEDMLNCLNTTTRRFEIRPVVICVESLLSYDDIITTIRREMCHGFGVKGPRNQGRIFGVSTNDDMASETSSNDFLSDGVLSEINEEDDNAEPPSEMSDFDGLRLRKIRYIVDVEHQNYYGAKTTITREYFITYKTLPKTGEVIYGAAISRRPAQLGNLTSDEADEHYATAVERMRKRPVWMRISTEFRHQLNSRAPHREDVMYEILDKINSRPGGRFLIRGERR